MTASALIMRAATWHRDSNCLRSIFATAHAARRDGRVGNSSAQLGRWIGHLKGCDTPAELTFRLHDRKAIAGQPLIEIQIEHFLIECSRVTDPLSSPREMISYL